MKREVKRDHQPEAVQLVGWKTSFCHTLHADFMRYSRNHVIGSF